MSDRKALAREIAARTKPHFIEMPSERGGVRVPVHRGATLGHARRPDCRGISVEADPRVVRLRLRCAMAVIAIVIAGVIFSATSALAAPPPIEEFCFAQAAQIWFNGRGDREHFIANCMADLTPTPPAKGSRYKAPR